MDGKRKILIVDDNEFILHFLDTTLSGAGYETVRCGNGREALEQIKHHKFSAVITDIMMPEKDGVTLVNEMREMNIQTPVLAISGDREGQKADELLSFACYFADEVIPKPIRKDELLKTVEMVIKNSRL